MYLSSVIHGAQVWSSNKTYLSLPRVSSTSQVWATFPRQCCLGLSRRTTHIWANPHQQTTLSSGSFEKEGESLLCVTSSSDQFLLFVVEVYRRVGESFADCDISSISDLQLVCDVDETYTCHKWLPTWPGISAVARERTVYEGGSTYRTNQITNLATRVQVRDCFIHHHQYIPSSFVWCKSYIPLKSVETPVAKRPLEATANEPPRSTILAIVPPWRMLRRFW